MATVTLLAAECDSGSRWPTTAGLVAFFAMIGAIVWLVTR